MRGSANLRDEQVGHRKQQLAQPAAHTAGLLARPLSEERSGLTHRRRGEASLAEVAIAAAVNGDTAGREGLTLLSERGLPSMGAPALQLPERKSRPDRRTKVQCQTPS